MNRDQMTADYAAGVLHPALRLMVEAQDTIDGELARDSEIAAAAGGAWLESENPAPMKDNALDTALSSIRETPMDSAARAARQAGQRLAELAAVPEPILDHAIEAASGRGWKSPMKGVRRLELMRDGDLTAELIHVKSGVSVPAHGHSGREYTLCLQGEFLQDGKVYGRGDMVIADGETVHAPRADGEEDVLVYAVTEAPLKYRGVAGLLQKILGFR